MRLIKNWYCWQIILLIINAVNGQSVNQPRISPCAVWNANATTFANVSFIGSQSYGVFVDIHNNVYATNKASSSVQIWRGGNAILPQNISGELDSPHGIFVTSNGDIYVDNGDSFNRVEKWSSNGTNRTIVMYVNGSCWGLFVDIYENLYCAIANSNRVIKRLFNETANRTVTIAGTGSASSASHMLNNPRGIFVDTDLNLYVADCYNDRIQLFRPNQLNGTAVVGSGAPNTITLDSPTGIVFDADGYLFISDSSNDRIVGSSADGFRCIVGCSNATGTQPNRLNGPSGISFDSFGNLFVVDTYNNRLQKFYLKTNPSSSSSNKPKFSPCATWNADAITFANASSVGSSPYGIFVDIYDAVYVVDDVNDRIQVWFQGNTLLGRSLAAVALNPWNIFVTTNRDIYIVNGNPYHRVNKWLWNSTNLTTIMDTDGSCWGIFVDACENIYCSLSESNLVLKRSVNSTISAIAGNGTNGSASSLLNEPRGIFLDKNSNLYVADCLNHRIQFFQSGQRNGTTVAGDGAPGTILLSYPSAVILDGDEHLFIADTINNRIVASTSNGFHCIVGCSGRNGDLSNELSFPRNLAFDSNGNLFVADTENHRIQKFLLATNSCYETTTTFDETSLSVIDTTVSPFITSTSGGISTSTTTSTVLFLTSSTFENISSSTMDDTTVPVSSSIFKDVSPSTIMTTLRSLSSSTSKDILLSTTGHTVLSVSSSTDSVSTITPTNAVEASHPTSTQPTTSMHPSYTSIASNRTIPADPCKMFQPCQNHGTCVNHNLTTLPYTCSCPPGFTGVHCGVDQRPCQSDTCWNDGTCSETSNTTFVCSCRTGWTDLHCQTQINYCSNVTCLNNGVCQPLLQSYRCFCLGDSYSGQHCEIRANALVVRETVSRSFAYVAIIAIASVAMFIVTLDLLKYFLGVDPARKTSQLRKYSQKTKTRKSPVIIRFTYINAPLAEPSN